jgi:hypothetical protein
MVASWYAAQEAVDQSPNERGHLTRHMLEAAFSTVFSTHVLYMQTKDYLSTRKRQSIDSFCFQTALFSIRCSPLHLCRQALQ